MLYGGTAVVPVILCLYLLLRKGNAIVTGITPPMRLRRWAAAFFAMIALGHIWWLLFCIFSRDMHSASYVVVCMLDCMTLMTTVSGTQLSMLQDRKRPIWPFATATIPFVILGGLQIARPGTDFIIPAFVYFLSLYVFFTVYMAIAVRQYGRWLRDNYADLEHKEVWLSHMLLIVFLLLAVFYGVARDTVSFYLLRFIEFLLYGLLLWRVETLPQLEVVSRHEEDSQPAPQASSPEPATPTQKAQTIPSNIGQLLAEHCVDTQLYLQHDLSLAQLSAAIGVNRLYISQYFSSQGINYNAYINDLRINHFVSLYQKAVASQQNFTAQQLAQECGYRSYSTFSLAFKQRMGQSVTTWMREAQATE